MCDDDLHTPVTMYHFVCVHINYDYKLSENISAIK